MKYILMMQFPLASWRTQRLDVWPTTPDSQSTEFSRND
jgi:hypothetical protein